MSHRSRQVAIALAMLSLLPFASASKKQPMIVRITVNVASPDGDPIRNAGVVIRQISDASHKKLKDPLHIELKTDPHGAAFTDLFEPGVVEVQVIAEGFQTWGAYYAVQKPAEQINIKLRQPKAQISIYK